MVHEREDIEGLDAAILMHPKVWEASGHVAGFSDPLVDCKHCKNRFRADDPRIKGTPGQPDAQCPVCGSRGTLTAPRMFNLMFKTFMGPVEEAAAVVYLRPETAQGIYVNYLNVLQSSRQKIPFGIAQIGKAFRNEITPGNFTFRTREFEQMELEYFVPPEEGQKWFEYWCEERMRWYLDYGIPSDMLKLRQHDPDELSHYSAGTADIEFLYPWGWGELEGIANRTDFDLTKHGEFSGKDLSYFDQENNRRYVPHVIEPSAGADRGTLAFLLAAYAEEEVRGETRTVLRLDPRLAPIKVAVLALSKNEKLSPVARDVAAALRPVFQIDYDEAGAIGRRYRRHDEIGTPYCVTIDFDSLDDKAVTVRERDSMAQERVSIDQLISYLGDRLPR